MNRQGCFVTIGGSLFLWGCIAGLVLLLSGCAHVAASPPEPVIRTVEVKVPVSVPCPALEQLGPTEPAYPDTNDALSSAANIFERVKLLLQGRAQRDARLQQYHAAKGSC